MQHTFGVPNTLIAHVKNQRGRASPRSSRQKRRETHVERPARYGSDARRQQSLKEAVQNPSCKDDDQAAIKLSRAELDVHGPGTSTGRLSMTKSMQFGLGSVQCAVTYQSNVRKFGCFAASHPRGKKRR